MIKKLKLMILSLSYALMLAAPVAVVASPIAYAATSPAQTEINNNLCKGSNLNLGTNPEDCSTTSSAGDSVTSIIRKVINVLSVIIGAIAVVMIIIGGFRYITSAGNPEQAKGARSTILYAIIGLVIVAVAQIIVRFVLNAATNP